MKNLIAKAKVAEGDLKDKLITKIIEVCSSKTYSIITDFVWYIEALCEMARITDASCGQLIAQQLLDVVIRVKAVRPAAVPAITGFLSVPHVFTTHAHPSYTEILLSASYIAGEYAKHLEHPLAVVEAMLGGTKMLGLPAHIQAGYIQNSVKILGFVAGLVSNDIPEDEIVYVVCLLFLCSSCSSSSDLKTMENRKAVLTQMDKVINESLAKHFVCSTNMEVQERACLFVSLLGMARESGFSGEIMMEINLLFAEEVRNLMMFVVMNS